MKHTIEVTNVCKAYGKKTILNQISFTANEGRVTAFLGPNGAGKSTTLRILFGLDRTDSGSATIDGKKYSDFKEPLKMVGASFDGVGAPNDRTVYQHLKIVAVSNGISLSRIKEVLQITAMEHKANSHIGNLSLGEGQRVGIATAILGDPQFLVLDEPTNGLDPQGIRWFREFIKKQAQEGKTVLLSSHILSEVEMVTDDVIIIHKGNVISKGHIDTVLNGFESLEKLFFHITEGGDKNE